jgi:ElaB/YqjD/DUF883 family membrane-anchored ribosome-binding protein
LATDVFINQGSSPWPREWLESRVNAIASDLDELVGRIEAELQETGTFSAASAERLHELRHTVEQLFERGRN